MLLYPTIQELTKGECNRYQLVVAVAKGTRMVTDENISKCQNNRSLLGEEKRASTTDISELEEEKAMTTTVKRIVSGEYKIVTFDDEDCVAHTLD